MYSISLYSGEMSRVSCYTLSPFGNQPGKKLDCRKKIPTTAKPISAGEIGTLADKGEDVSRFFSGNGHMVNPMQRVNVDITDGMLKELDCAAANSTLAGRLSSRRLSVTHSINTIWQSAQDSNRRNQVLKSNWIPRMKFTTDG